LSFIKKNKNDKYVQAERGLLPALAAMNKPPYRPAHAP